MEVKVGSIMVAYPEAFEPGTPIIIKHFKPGCDNDARTFVKEKRNTLKTPHAVSAMKCETLSKNDNETTWIQFMEPRVTFPDEIKIED